PAAAWSRSRDRASSFDPRWQRHRRGQARVGSASALCSRPMRQRAAAGSSGARTSVQAGSVVVVDDVVVDDVVVVVGGRVVVVVVVVPLDAGVTRRTSPAVIAT